MFSKKNLKILIPITIIGLVIVSFFTFFRLDLTSDKRYSISEPSKILMAKTEEPLRIVVYLDGDLNPGFQRLKKSTIELLDELAIYSDNKPLIVFENPSSADSPETREKKYQELAKAGIIPTAVYEHDKEGKSIRKIIFPWLEISYKNKKVQVNLLKNISGNSGEENLNISIENLEFEITDGIRRLTNKTVNKIAFLEGQGEFSEPETFDICKTLSRYFQIDRGVLGTNPAILDNYKVVIIAGPTQSFNESEKFILDQYVMNGGRILWLVDGVRVDRKQLAYSGISPAMELETNLSDLLFRYGVRINPVILQDVQCTNVPVNIAPAGESPKFEPAPFYLSPLLLTSPQHPVSRNVSEVRAEFCSGISLVGDNKLIKCDLLLATSDNTHILGTPEMIDLSKKIKPNDKNYFNVGYIPVGVALEGKFESAFANRLIPKNLPQDFPVRKKSVNTRQIVIACSKVIQNEISAKDSTILPLGFDRYMNQQFGNKDFILNAVLYLADNDGWMQLRSREMKLRLLNKRLVNENKISIQLVNLITPLILFFIFGIVYQIMRKRKYTKN